MRRQIAGLASGLGLVLLFAGADAGAGPKTVYKSDGTTVVGVFNKFLNPCIVQFADTSTGATGLVLADVRRKCVDAVLYFTANDCSGTPFVADQGTQHIGYNGTLFYLADRSGHDCTADADCGSGASAIGYGSFRTHAGGCTVDAGTAAAYPAIALTSCGNTRSDRCVVR